MRNVEKKLKQFVDIGTNPPENVNLHNEWLDQIDFINFLKENIQNDDVILFASLGDFRNYIFVYAVLVPIENLSPQDNEDLLQWDCNPTRQWGMCGLSESDYVLCPPISSPISKSLNNAIQMLFLRRFDAKAENKRYIEITETLLQPHDLHYMPESSSYCTFNEDGDVKPIIKILCRDDEDATLVTINKEILKKHLNITKCSLIRFFDARRMPGEYNYNSKLKQTRVKKKSICYDKTYFDDKQSSIRGFQLVKSSDVKIKTKNSKKNMKNL